MRVRKHLTAVHFLTSLLSPPSKRNHLYASHEAAWLQNNKNPSLGNIMAAGKQLWTWDRAGLGAEGMQEGLRASPQWAAEPAARVLHPESLAWFCFCYSSKLSSPRPAALSLTNPKTGLESEQ